MYVPLERYSRCILFTSHQCYGSKSEGSISFSQIRKFFLLIRMHTQISWIKIFKNIIVLNKRAENLLEKFENFIFLTVILNVLMFKRKWMRRNCFDGDLKKKIYKINKIHIRIPWNLINLNHYETCGDSYFFKYSFKVRCRNEHTASLLSTFFESSVLSSSF